MIYLDINENSDLVSDISSYFDVCMNLRCNLYFDDDKFSITYNTNSYIVYNYLCDFTKNIEEFSNTILNNISDYNNKILSDYKFSDTDFIDAKCCKGVDISIEKIYSNYRGRYYYSNSDYDYWYIIRELIQDNFNDLFSTAKNKNEVGGKFANFLADFNFKISINKQEYITLYNLGLELSDYYIFDNNIEMSEWFFELFLEDLSKPLIKRGYSSTGLEVTILYSMSNMDPYDKRSIIINEINRKSKSINYEYKDIKDFNYLIFLYTLCYSVIYDNNDRFDIEPYSVDLLLIKNDYNMHMYKHIKYIYFYKYNDLLKHISGRFISKLRKRKLG